MSLLFFLLEIYLFRPFFLKCSDLDLDLDLKSEKIQKSFLFLFLKIESCYISRFMEAKGEFSVLPLILFRCF